MKLRDLPRALGRQQAPREYPHAVETFVLPTDGEVRLARWLHPAETAKFVTQGSVDALRSFLSQGDVAIDIGAHTGDSTIPIALAVGPSGSVFALEPNPYVFKVLAINAGLNPDSTHIVPLMFAAMPDDGEFEFEYSDCGYCNGGLHQGISRWAHGHFSELRVAGRNLPAYLHIHAPDALPRIRFVKIDTEGFDRAVTCGRSRISSRRSGRIIKTEIYRHLSHQQRTGFTHDDLRRLEMSGCSSAKTTREYRGQEIGRGDLSRWRHFDIFAVPDERA